MIAQLLAVLLAAGPVAPPNSSTPEVLPSVVALTSGQAMLVQSYRLDGRMLRIVSTDGQALILKAELFDRERSEKMTAAYRERLESASASRRKAEELAEVQREQREQRNAAHLAQSSGAGVMWVAPTADDGIITQPLTKTLQNWDDKGLDGDGQDRVIQHNRKVLEHNELVARLAEDDSEEEALGPEITRMREAIAALRGGIREARSVAANAAKAEAEAAAKADGEAVAAKN